MSQTTHHSDTDKNKQLVNKFVEQVLTRHDVAAADKYFAHIPVNNNQQVLGTQGFKKLAKDSLKNFQIQAPQ